MTQFQSKLSQNIGFAFVFFQLWACGCLFRLVFLVQVRLSKEFDKKGWFGEKPEWDWDSTLTCLCRLGRPWPRCNFPTQKWRRFKRNSKFEQNWEFPAIIELSAVVVIHPLHRCIVIHPLQLQSRAHPIKSQRHITTGWGCKRKDTVVNSRRNVSQAILYRNILWSW